jgi:hypothetical protein
VLCVAAVLSIVDAFAFFTRLFTYLYGLRANPGSFSLRSFWRTTFLNRADKDVLGSTAEYAGLVLSEDPEELEEHQMHKLGRFDIVFSAGDQHEDDDATSEWVNDKRPAVHRQNSGSTERTRHSDETLRDPTTPVRSHFPKLQTKVSLARRISTGLFATVERVLVFAAWAEVAEGIVVYTGGCRQNYLNGCLAHIISTLSFSGCTDPL